MGAVGGHCHTSQGSSLKPLKPLASRCTFSSTSLLWFWASPEMADIWPSHLGLYRMCCQVSTLHHLKRGRSKMFSEQKPKLQRAFAMMLLVILVRRVARLGSEVARVVSMQRRQASSRSVPVFGVWVPSVGSSIRFVCLLISLASLVSYSETRRGWEMVHPLER